MNSFRTILIERKNNVLAITLNRPERYNAITGDMAIELKSVISGAEHDENIRSLLITGSGKGFCAGQDLLEFQSPNEGFSIRDHLHQTLHPIIMEMRKLEKPIVCAVNGACAGAGLGLALASDICYASENAKFRTAFIAIGLVPDSGTSYWLPRLLGYSRAAELLFTNEIVDAETAKRYGIVNEIFSHKTLQQNAMELSQRLASGPTKAIGLTKRILNRSLHNTNEEVLKLEAETQGIAEQTSDYTEGLAAFFEKREPHFIGK